MRDFFFNRVMFPITDGRGRVIAFGGAGAGSRRQAQIHQQRRNHALFQGPQSLQFRHRPRRRDQGRHHHPGRRLYGCDRAGARRLRPCRGAAGHGAHRRSAAAFVAHRARTHSGVRRRRRRSESRASRRPSGAAASEGGLFAALCLPAGRRGSRQFLGARAAPARCGRCWMPHCPCRKCCGAPRPRARTFPHPSAAPGWNRRFPDIAGQIGDAKVADYYRRDFDQKIFDNFKRRQPAPRPRGRPIAAKPSPRGQAAVPAPAGHGRGGVSRGQIQPSGPGGPGRTGPAGGPGTSRKSSLAALLLEQPQLAHAHGEQLAELQLSRPFA